MIRNDECILTEEDKNWFKELISDPEKFKEAMNKMKNMKTPNLSFLLKERNKENG